MPAPLSRLFPAALLAGALALAGCGDTPAEQALIGAGAGAVAAGATNGNPVRGAVYGAAGNVAFCQAYPERCR